jgi:hypothetical protein
MRVSTVSLNLWLLNVEDPNRAKNNQSVGLPRAIAIETFWVAIETEDLRCDIGS